MTTRKNIKEKSWFEIECDGKIIGILEESNLAQSELDRWCGLKGVVVRSASPGNLIRYNAKTVLPRTILSRFQNAVWEDEAKKKKRYW